MDKVHGSLACAGDGATVSNRRRREIPPSPHRSIKSNLSLQTPPIHQLSSNLGTIIVALV
ncbi:hypothetical protein TSUD_344000 [Trifolium subterraneum]|nr:hypothetical protein TSUD_344000 [Trifolium subterraneum]